MKDTGERNESALLRKLVDEALDARRKKIRSAPLTEESDHAGGRLETIESLLMRLVRYEDVSFRIEDVCLALLQDILAEAYATAGSYGSVWSGLNYAPQGLMRKSWSDNLP
jgi:hypothetical protein